MMCGLQFLCCALTELRQTAKMLHTHLQDRKCFDQEPTVLVLPQQK